jgi:hypothetical protein
MKKNKNVFYKCGLESYFTSISGLGGFILSKKLKSLYPAYTMLAPKAHENEMVCAR